MNEANASIEWLEIQKSHLIARKNALRKPKGMLSGLIAFGLFSIIGILTPLILVPFKTEDYILYSSTKYVAIFIFGIGLLTVFIYLVSLLKWKEKV